MFLQLKAWIRAAILGPEVLIKRESPSAMRSQRMEQRHRVEVRDHQDGVGKSGKKRQSKQTFSYQQIWISIGTQFQAS